MEKQIDQGVKSVYTASQILLMMVQGAIYGAIALCGIAGFIAVFYWFGRIFLGG